MKKDECGAIFLLALGVFYLIISFDFDMGTMANPQPGLFPRIIGGFMVLFSSLVLISSLKKRGEKESLSGIWKALDLRSVFSVVIVIGCVSVYLVILDTVGFLLSSPPLVFALAWLMGGKNPIVNGIIGVVTSVVVYWVFWILMRIPIPLGNILPK